MTAVAELIVRSPVEPWQSVGLRVDDRASWIGGVCIRFVDPVDDQPQQMLGWTLVGSPSTPVIIDGLPTTYLDEIDVLTWDHRLGVTGVDHVVAMSSSVERTCGAIERVTAEPLRRIREAGPVRQGFHRLGPVIVEVVESDRTPPDAAQFWGFVLVVDDLHETVGTLGPDVISAPRPAVQPGRFIASFRAQAGLGVPVALMSPHVR